MTLTLRPWPNPYDKAKALTTSPPALLQQEKEDSNRDWKKVV